MAAWMLDGMSAKEEDEEVDCLVGLLGLEDGGGAAAFFMNSLLVETLSLSEFETASSFRDDDKGGGNSALRSASKIIFRAARSFPVPPGFKLSILTYNLTLFLRREERCGR